MMKIGDLLDGSTGNTRFNGLQFDPLRQPVVLQESQILEVLFDAVTNVAGVLLELRQSIDLDEANTGVLVCRGLDSLAWQGSTSWELTAWSIVGCEIQHMDGSICLTLSLSPSATLKLTITRVEFYLIDVPRIGEAPPNYAKNDRAKVASYVAGWDSHFEMVGASSLDARA